MPYLLDTNILLRLANADDTQHVLTTNAVASLYRAGEKLHVTAQNLIEFRNVATRPIARNGLGMSALLAAQVAASQEAAFPLLEETPNIYPTWKTLVDALGITGKQVHDTRLVAVCHVHGITHILTFNGKDFTRFQGAGPGLVVVDPNTV